MANVLSIVNNVDHREGDLSAAAAVLPQQFYGARRGTSEAEPLRRLMVAMLLDAVRCFQTKFNSHQPARSQEFAEVRTWLFSNAKDGPFSFTAVCEALELDPNSVRGVLANWEEKKLAGQKPRIIRRSSLPAKRISA
jgi:hypothetical protein